MTANTQTIAFTLPISCQICLGKVKQPVICCNQHVFCSSCMDVWLERNTCCPACRVPVTPDNPCRPVIGGLSLDTETDSGENSLSGREIRHARLELFFKDYEKIIDRLQSELEVVRNENHVLREKLDKTPCQQCPSARIHDSLEVQMLRSNLQDATIQQNNMKQQIDALNMEAAALRDANILLERENQRLRVDLTNRSPRRFGRYTVVTLESKLEACEKEVQQLHRALEKSDEHIFELEKELELCRKSEMAERSKPHFLSSSSIVDEYCAPRETGYDQNLMSANIQSSGMSCQDIESVDMSKSASPEVVGEAEYMHITAVSSGDLCVPADSFHLCPCSSVSSQCKSVESSLSLATQSCKKRLRFSQSELTDR